MSKSKSIVQSDEIWRDIDWIPNLRGSYKVSSLGRVIRTSYYQYCGKSKGLKLIEKTYELTPFDNGHGYKVVGLSIDTDNGLKRKNYYVHRLVAIAFIPNPLHKKEVNHLDYDKSHNFYTNLEWCDNIENLKYSNCHAHHPRSKSSGIRFKDGKYEVAINFCRKNYYLGRFMNYQEALQARNDKFKELGVIINV